MITGDHPTAAIAIASQIGLITDLNDKVWLRYLIRGSMDMILGYWSGKFSSKTEFKHGCKEGLECCLGRGLSCNDRG